jgi:Protein of unknown function (DUF1236)
MKNIFMITASVATLIAMGGLASAQGVNEQRERPAQTSPEQKAPTGKADQQKPNAPQKSESVRPAPTAQAPDKPAGAKSESVGKGDRTAPTEAARTESMPDSPAALSTEHHGRFRETIRSEKVAPLSDVRFSVTIGEAIPRTVHLNKLPARILEYAPQYRGYEYILVGDDILIVDPRTLRIVAVIAA